jgi:hypothetical protein
MEWSFNIWMQNGISGCKIKDLKITTQMEEKEKELNQYQKSFPSFILDSCE